MVNYLKDLRLATKRRREPTSLAKLRDKCRNSTERHVLDKIIGAARQGMSAVTVLKDDGFEIHLGARGQVRVHLTKSGDAAAKLLRKLKLPVILSPLAENGHIWWTISTHWRS